ncbi:pyridoxal phosphate-dependent aminotransferase [Paraburkholderia phymatum]|uniref:Pyridoxal phosphate-dependent aminotransferase n=1 Tax=Paraburkholderia phymatum TaxID=148447 RepID=A0ACC6UDY1_9BURK
MNFSTTAESIRGSKNAALDEIARKRVFDGKRVTDFSKGELSISPPSEFLENAGRAIRSGLHGYTEAIGVRALREQLAAYVNDRYKIEASADEIAVTAGAKPALYGVMLSIINPGDEVVVLTPYWSTFPEQIMLARGIPKVVRCIEASGAIDLLALDESTTASTKAIVINSPNNPTGVVYSDSSVKEVIRIASRHGAFVIFDQSYYSLTFETDRTSSFRDLVCDYDRAVIVDSFSKCWALTGWRIGYVFAHPSLINLLKSIQTHTNSNPNSITQFALLWTLEGSGVGRYEMDLVAMLAKRRDRVATALSTISGMSFPRPAAGFFAFADSRCTNRSESTGQSADELCREMLNETGVLVVPGSAFGTSYGFRISYAGDEQQLDEGLNAMVEYFR